MVGNLRPGDCLSPGRLYTLWRAMKRVLFFFLGLIFWNLPAQAQLPVRLSGTLNVATESYMAHGQAPTQAYRPDWTSRLILRPTLMLGTWFSLPFELYLSTQGQRFQGPSPIGLQPFNQLGFSPRIGNWLQLHLGSFNQPLSEFSVGALRLRGVGAIVTPGALRLAFLYGQSQPAQEPDLARGYPGAYARRLWAAQIGYQTQGSELLLTLTHQKDDTSRGQRRAYSNNYALPAYENAVVTLNWGFSIGPFMRFRSEVALSAFSNDLRSETLDLNVPSWLFTPRYSSNLDGAARAHLSITPVRDFNLQLEGRWIGPGFVTLGQPYLQNDLFELTAAPSFRLFDQRLHVRLRGGFRQNNLRNNRLATTTRTLGAIDLSWQPAQHFGLDAAYSNYGLTLEPQADTLRLRNIAQQFSLMPRLLYTRGAHTHTVSVGYTLQDSQDRTFFQTQTQRNQTHSLLLLHNYQAPSRFSLSSSLSYSSAQTAALRTRFWTLTESMRYPFRPNLNSHVSLGFSRIRDVATRTQLGLRWGLEYRLPAPYGGTIGLNHQLRKLWRRGAGFTENLVMLHYSRSW
jgi:hypothetical protein